MAELTIDQERAATEDLLSLPITAVTCLEDRAQVERSGVVEVAAGVRRLRIGPVTPLAVDRSLRAEAIDVSGVGDVGVTVVDARVVRAAVPAPPRPGEDASKLRTLVHDLKRDEDDLLMRQSRTRSALDVVRQARDELHRALGEFAGIEGDAPAVRFDTVDWAGRLAAVDAAEDQRHDELFRINEELSRVAARRRDAEAALGATEENPAELRAVVEVVVEAERAGPVELRVAHLVPCALWRPAYRATLAADGTALTLESDAVVWQRTGEDWTDVRLSLSTARPTLAARPPSLVEDELRLRDKSDEEKRTVEVDLREEEISKVGTVASSAADLPGVDDGGEVRVLAAPTPATVPSDGRAHRVHLTSFTAGSRTELAATPELSPLVTRVAHAPNEAGHVLLAGPVDLVRASGFVGRGQLKFTGQGEELRLSFGSEDTFRIVRHTSEEKTTKAVTGRTTTTRTVRVFVSHLSGDGEPVAVVLRERIPVSEVSAVEVALKTDACSPPPASVDAEGIVRYDLTLAPGERRAVTLVYELSASGKVAGL
ncbi:mucoidy inhibitor MuiA family protein [Yinghuangia sp. YIM S10712]|uniref:mucoidy inhibitor MuiA family protein n=1 Tax=Yinghuangia sp. YIM S10712 TaxID=3436930 RepID=UPI003F52A226